MAFFVLALAVAAVTRMSYRSIDTASQLRARLLADWVAQDRLEESRAMREWPAIGVREGDVEQAGLGFHWREVVAPTATRQFRRIEVIVTTRSDPESVLARQLVTIGEPGS